MACLRAVLGVWVAAGLIALVFMAALVAAWSRIEALVFAPRRPPFPIRPVPDRSGLTAGDHVAFARALTAVATAYLAECERQEHER
jgi:hypothetical protein